MSLATRSIKPLAALIALALAGPAAAFDSGSTGADLALNPTVDTTVQLPANGVLNYTNINIPIGVKVTFQKNATNTPVVILVGGDATVAGTIDVSGSAAAAVGAAGNGNIGDDGNPGLPGPGGFSGGQGGRASATVSERTSQRGLGPGGAFEAIVDTSNQLSCGGSGAGYGTDGNPGANTWCGSGTRPGPSYGTPNLLPLIGGSGGAGGAGGSAFRGGGGGGGGGAIAIAVSGTLSVTGTIRADGGAGGNASGAGAGAAGGGGSGGAVRLVATNIDGNGAITAAGGAGPRPSERYHYGGNGAHGRVRLESEVFNRTAATSPAYTFGAPGPIFVAGLPSLKITQVAGVDAPAAPTGSADIALPEETVNPVVVEVATTGVPLGNTVTLVVTPAYGAATSYISNALSGSEEAGTATASVTLPAGPSTLLATVSYSVPEAVAMQSPYREISGADDLIERIAMQAMPDGTTRRIATTRSGREIDLSAVVSFGS